MNDTELLNWVEQNKAEVILEPRPAPAWFERNSLIVEEDLPHGWYVYLGWPKRPQNGYGPFPTWRDVVEYAAKEESARILVYADTPKDIDRTVMVVAKS